jgi:RNA-directed DNA polymerase
MTAVATLAGAPPYRAVDWNSIDWERVNRNVRRLQARIVKAIEEGRCDRGREMGQGESLAMAPDPLV